VDNVNPNFSTKTLNHDFFKRLICDNDK